jgi:ATP-dependent exoDNAse (exonuclease V) beta subunit
VTRPADAEARCRIAGEFGTTFFVEAAAGTGKTTALVRRIVGLVGAGITTLDRVAAVTFTEKAAGETKLQLRSEIEAARATPRPEQRARLDRALEALELARIGTIHAFCADLLHERPVEAHIDPLFAVAADAEAQALVDEAFDGWFETVLGDPPEGVRRLLRRRSERVKPREQLRTAMMSLLDHRDFPAPWRRDTFDRDKRIDALVTELAELAALGAHTSSPTDSLARNLAGIGRFIADATRLEEVSGRDYDGLEAGLRDLAHRWGWRDQGRGATTFGHMTRDDARARRDRVKADLDAFVAASDADLAPLLHEALQAPIAAYEQLKIGEGRLDFLDLLIDARDLIRGNAAVRNELQRRYTHFFIDEFQDTDPLQVEILLLLAADDPAAAEWRTARPVPGKLFLVGDPKQSIYRFRRADIALYEEMKVRLVAAGAELLQLTTSFRAPPSIQSFVNAAFSAAMTPGPDCSQAGYVALEPSRPEIAGRPTLVALPVPRPYSDSGRITKARIDESFPGAAAAFVHWLVDESGWTVEERGAPTPIQPRHISLLFRRFRSFGRDVTRGYVRALEARGIPHVLVGGRSFHDCEEIIALRAALTAIEWPDDELSVFATLRGPFFALNDEALLLFRQVLGEDGSPRDRRLDPMRTIDRSAIPPGAAEVADALELLRDLHVGRNRRPIAQTITTLLDGVRAHAGIALWPNGEQALANVQRLVDMARRFERGASSFRAFVDSLASDAERGEADEAPIVEEGTEGVRLMTVHKAKGLEFPVVILADPTCAAARDTPGRHVVPARRLWLGQLCGSAPVELLEAAQEEQQREEDEAIRVAYVAATRARDLLVAPVCGDRAIEGWLGVLDPALYPPHTARSTASSGPGCPIFGADSVLDRGPKGDVRESGPVRPGLHRPIRNGPPVVWWDPSRLVLEVAEPLPLRHQQILEGGSESAAASEANYVAWLEERESLRARASAPSLAVNTITSLARSRTRSPETGPEVEVIGEPGPQSAATYPEVGVEMVTRPEEPRPGGRRFGALVHAILATIELDADAEAIQASAAANARMFDATTEETDAAIIAVAAAVRHPVLRRAAASAKKGGIRRETPLLLTLGDGSMAEGVLDLAFREKSPDFDGWTVVDFKTDREFSTAKDQYCMQVRLYAQGVKAATNLPARGIILVV